MQQQGKGGQPSLLRAGMNIGLACAALVVSACSVGKDFVVEPIGQIREGITTKRDVLAHFGDPYQKGLDSGSESWRYFYGKKAGKHELSKELYIVFSKSGTVKAYTFTTNFPGEGPPAVDERPTP